MKKRIMKTMILLIRFLFQLRKDDQRVVLLGSFGSSSVAVVIVRRGHLNED
jgi:hypothetical protein